MEAHDLKPLKERFNPQQMRNRKARMHARGTYRDQALQRDVQLANMMSGLANAHARQQRNMNYLVAGIIVLVAVAALGRVVGWW